MELERAAGGKRDAVVWAAAAAVAALGTWILYDAFPGINWPIWTIAAASGLIWLTRDDANGRRPVAAVAILAMVIAGGAAVSAAEFMYLLIVLSVIVLLAVAMLLTAKPAIQRITAGFVIAAPIVALTNAAVAAFRRGADATQLVGSPRARAWLRGVLITAPIVIVFALLLAVADPTFALWRNTVRDLVTDWEFLPRTVFFIALLGLTLGAYGYAASQLAAEPATGDARSAQRWLGSTERLMLLAGVSGVLWLFMIVQLTYLFGNLPEVPGSGVTFAEYARRGFGEMTIVAAASTLLIVVSERYGQPGERDSVARVLTFALIVAVLFLLVSAFNRVLLYEQAYGYTHARLYAQAFMLIVGAGILALSAEVVSGLEPGRLFRRVAAFAALTLVTLLYWNHEAWIAEKNIERFAATGKLDSSFLVHDLSANALPTIVAKLPSLPDPLRSEIRAHIGKRYTGVRRPFVPRWYEWNLHRERARATLDSLGIK